MTHGAFSLLSAFLLSVSWAFGADRLDAWKARRAVGELVVSDPLAKTYEWIGKDVSGTGVPRVMGKLWRKRRVAILFMPRCPSCQINADALDPEWLHMRTPIILVTDDEAVQKIYRHRFLVDEQSRLLPPEWTMTGSHLFFVDVAGRVDEIVSGSNGLHLRLAQP